MGFLVLEKMYQNLVSMDVKMYPKVLLGVSVVPLVIFMYLCVPVYSILGSLFWYLFVTLHLLLPQLLLVCYASHKCRPDEESFKRFFHSMIQFATDSQYDHNLTGFLTRRTINFIGTKLITSDLVFLDLGICTVVTFANGKHRETCVGVFGTWIPL